MYRLHFFLLALSLYTLSACAQEDYEGKAKALPQTTVEWEETQHSFGTINQMQTVEHTFHFTNTGTEPLHIVTVKVSCGCTVPSWETEPVMPGEKGSVTVSYDSKARVGHFNKLILVYGNFGTKEPRQKLYIMGDILKGTINY